MKTYLKIQSAGEIETEAFTLIGASSKRDDATKIGYFGSGLKYSISALLRNNIGFKIFQGENEILFSVVDKPFRGEIYRAISVNGKETSMTTTMGGSDWDIPFAPIREIYSNAIDEDEDASLELSTDLKGDSGFTSIFIEKNADVSHFYENFEQYFCNKNPKVLSTSIYCAIYPGTPEGSVRLFRKGILAFHDEKIPSLFTYNSQLFDINESRVLINMYSAKCHIAKGLKATTNKSVISDLINGLAGGNSGKFEHTLDFSWYADFSEEWFEVCKDKKFIPAEMVMFCKPNQLIDRLILPKALLVPLYKQFQDLDVLGLAEQNAESHYIVDNEPSDELINKVIDACALLQETNYKNRMKELKIIYANFEDKNTLGMADNGKIILSTKLDCEDIPYIAKIIIEENEHNLSNYGDETREFQNHFIKLYYSELTSKKH